MLSEPFLIVSILILVALIFFMIRFDYIVNSLRDIAKDPGGYFKFGQIVILFFAVLIFVILFVYNLFFPRESSSLDIFLTIVVGILGTVIGLFFGAKSEEFITEPRRDFVRSYVEETENITEMLENAKYQIISLKEELKKK